MRKEKEEENIVEDRNAKESIPYAENGECFHFYTRMARNLVLLL